MTTFLVTFLKFYKLYISPLLPSACRYVPTCSEYACEALIKHGLMAGIYMSVRRLCRCHPFKPGGYDPVP